MKTDNLLGNFSTIIIFRLPFLCSGFEWRILFFILSATTDLNDANSPMMRSLISRAGDLSKNNDLLKFALVSIRFPEAYNEAM